MGAEPRFARNYARKAEVRRFLTTLFLRTHRVVHRRVSMGYGGSADSGRAA